MPRSSGLAFYLATRSLPGRARPRVPTPEAAPAVRPEGDLAWFHAGPGTRIEALVELARRLSLARAGTSVLLTTGEALPPLSPPLLAATEPDDSQREVRRFLDHWRPDAILLAGEVVRPVAMVEAADRGIPLHLVDAHLPEAFARRLRWAPSAGATLFGRVSRILTPTEAEAETFRRLRAAPDRVEARGHLEEGTAPLPCNRRDHAALAALLIARPVWFAANVTEGEVEGVLAAHRRASRVAHRLLLILAPANPGDGPALRDALEQDGWTAALRSDGDEPDPDVQVFVADVPGEAGLWYRLAPVTFLGGSLKRGGAGHDPCEPAALGSAILVGPETGRYRPVVQRFLAAGAARTVASADALGEAVADLLAPDRAAEMARRAWEITSSGADLTDRVLDLLTAALDERADG